MAVSIQIGNRHPIGTFDLQICFELISVRPASEEGATRKNQIDPAVLVEVGRRGKASVPWTTLTEAVE